MKQKEMKGDENPAPEILITERSQRWWFGVRSGRRMNVSWGKRTSSQKISLSEILVKSRLGFKMNGRAQEARTALRKCLVSGVLPSVENTQLCCESTPLFVTTEHCLQICEKNTHTIKHTGFPLCILGQLRALLERISSGKRARMHKGS